MIWVWWLLRLLALCVAFGICWNDLNDEGGGLQGPCGLQAATRSGSGAGGASAFAQRPLLVL